MSVIPNVFKISKNAALILWAGAKVFKVDAIVALLAIASIFYWWLSPEEVSMAGAAAILFVYATWTIIRLNEMRKKLKKH